MPQEQFDKYKPPYTSQPTTKTTTRDIFGTAPRVAGFSAIPLTLTGLAAWWMKRKLRSWPYLSPTPMMEAERSAQTAAKATQPITKATPGKMWGTVSKLIKKHPYGSLAAGITGTALISRLLSRLRQKQVGSNKTIIL